MYDVARACRLAMESDADQQVFNGRSITIVELAERVARALHRKNIQPEITGRYRIGDIRYCYADVRRARDVLGFEPVMPLQTGLTDLAAWLRGQTASDRVLQ